MKMSVADYITRKIYDEERKNDRMGSLPMKTDRSIENNLYLDVYAWLDDINLKEGLSEELVIYSFELYKALQGDMK